MTASEKAWNEFQMRVEASGGIILGPQWLGSKKKHHVRCAEGHDCYPLPNSIQQGQGICYSCSGKDPVIAEANFYANVEKQGGEVVESSWLGNHNTHHVRCIEGHDCFPRPSDIQQGKGICRVCAGQDPITAEMNFRRQVADSGGTVIEPIWLGSNKPHQVLCVDGHRGFPRPSDIVQGQGICRSCGGNDPITAWDNFKARVKELGGEVLEPVWLGTGNPHHVRCKSGHNCYPMPGNIRNGAGICRTCKGMVWDVAYVVMNPTLGILKFGVTSGDPRPRLRSHAREGFTEVIRCHEVSDAADLERTLRNVMVDAGVTPVRGREYFPAIVLATILDIFDGWTNA